MIKENNLNIEQVTSEELEALREIGIKTFSETFSAENSEENMKKYSDEKFSIPRLQSELNNENSRFYFARRGESILGYLKVNWRKAQTELSDENSLEIERIYVQQKYLGQMIGQELYNKALEVAQETKVDFVWLGVWEENSRAIRFYERNGFQVFDKHIFELGEDKQTDLMMKLPLNYK